MYARIASRTKRLWTLCEIEGRGVRAPFCDEEKAFSAPWNEVLAFIEEGLESEWSTCPDEAIDWDYESGPIPHSYSLRR
jgi:hypothetical protein